MVKREIEVNLPRPRTHEVLTSAEFMQLKRETLALLLSEASAAVA